MTPRTNAGRIAVGYARVSTSGQAEDGVSLDAQREQIHAWCTLKGCTLAHVYVDVASGGKMNGRPQLAEALDHVCRERGILVTYSLSRLARSTTDAIGIAERLRKAKADLTSTSEDINTNSAGGRMVFKLLAVIADWERDAISERTRAGLQHLKAKGKRVSRHAPYGHKFNDAGEVIPDPAEQRTIRRVVALHRRGISYRSIIAKLADEGKLSRKGTPFSITTIQRIVKEHAAK